MAAESKQVLPECLQHIAGLPACQHSCLSVRLKIGASERKPMTFLCNVHTLYSGHRPDTQACSWALLSIKICLSVMLKAQQAEMKNAAYCLPGIG